MNRKCGFRLARKGIRRLTQRQTKYGNKIYVGRYMVRWS